MSQISINLIPRSWMKLKSDVISPDLMTWRMLLTKAKSRWRLDDLFFMIAKGTKLVKLKQVLFLFFHEMTGVCIRSLSDQDQYFFYFFNLLTFCPGTKNRKREPYLLSQIYIIFKKMSNQIHFMSEALYLARKLMIIFKSQIYLLQ